MKLQFSHACCSVVLLVLKMIFAYKHHQGMHGWLYKYGNAPKKFGFVAVDIEVYRVKQTIYCSWPQGCYFGCTVKVS